MSSDYNRICRENREAYGTSTWYEEILSRLYEEKTHFIFELLQNAEDAVAKRPPGSPDRGRVRFCLFPDKLECWHNGQPFDEADVVGICGMGRSTKKEDLTQIGKFGIGFKSVYAYTRRPEVYSGNENFAIEAFIQPNRVARREISHPWTTLLVLPFNHPTVPAAQAVREIAARFEALDSSTLFFLRAIRRVEWQLPDGSSGRFSSREKHLASVHGARGIVTVHSRSSGHIEAARWLGFDAPVDGESANTRLRVEAAFCLEERPKKGGHRVVGLDLLTLHVFFPTALPTKMRFLLQGPYRTTPARDNIPKDELWNRRLVEHSVALVRSALLSLKKGGMLDAETLRTLPLSPTDFPEGSILRPIFDGVVALFNEEEILPAEGGGFVVATRAMLARSSELRELFDATLLSELISPEEPVRWVSGQITSDRTPETYRYLTDVLEVEELTPEDVVRAVNPRFLEERSDDWILAFYRFLLGQEALWRLPRFPRDPPGPVRSLPIIRLENGTHVAPFLPIGRPAVYLTGPPAATGVPRVRGALLRDSEALKFLKRLGLADFDAFDGLRLVTLPKYLAQDKLVDPQENARDLEHIGQLLVSVPARKREILELLAMTPIVRCRNAATSAEGLRKPTEAYFESERLRLYFVGNASAWFVADDYPAKLRDVLRAIGVAEDVRVIRPARKVDARQRVTLYETWGQHRRGLEGFDPEFDIDGLAHALSQKDATRAQFVWEEIVLRHRRQLRGVVESSNYKDFREPKKTDASSKMAHTLTGVAWLPVGTGFARPCDVTLGDLPPDFTRDESLTTALGMKVDEIGDLAQKAGLEADDITLLRDLKREDPERLEALRRWHDARLEKPEFPDQAVTNPERRRGRVEQAIALAPDKEYQTRDRRVRTSSPEVRARAYLRAKYTNSERQMVCQLCQTEMPFRGRDGQHYCEAVEVADTEEVPVEYHAAFLALCPVCAAKYKEFVKRVPDAKRGVLAQIRTGEAPSVALTLGDEPATLRFSTVHWFDVRVLLGVEAATPQDRAGA